ncbi:MAG: hypothetical protein CVU55_04915 [Deltaproteobacteria bacterium HGW-Deltaproteobacteria-13]|nr:MAG: hypothetical protein CVU55_04915 [Deltaproteobacteria bacterium HGW-Deltaproteobacteria-13]
MTVSGSGGGFLPLRGAAATKKSCSLNNIMEIAASAASDAAMTKKRNILAFRRTKTMRNEKGIATWVIVLIIAIVIVAAIFWSRYFAKPMATVMMQGADQAQPAIEKAKRASDAVSKANQVTEDIAKKAGQEPAPEK